MSRVERGTATKHGALASFAAAVSCLVAAFWSAKLICLWLLARDGHLPQLNAQSALALLAGDARAALSCGAAAALMTAVHPRGRRPAQAWLGALALYAAVNVPITRMFCTPLSAAMLRATGAALSDSASAHLTRVDWLSMSLPLLAAACCSALLRRRPALAWLPVALAASVSFAPARWLRGDVASLGLHENAVSLLARSELALHRAHAQPAAGAASLPLEGPVLDLSEFSGAARGQHVVWIVLESTAARALASYGAARDPMPQLTQLAEQGLLFESAYAAYPESIKGLYSMLCARRVQARTRVETYTQAAAPCDSLPARLRAQGYRTGLFHSGRFAYLGMQGVLDARGFDVLADAAAIGGKFESSFGTADASTVESALAWLDGLPRSAKFFLMFLPIAGHHPYHSPSAARRPFPEHSDRDAYDNDLAVADQALGALVEGLRARGLLRDTLLVISADHGEAFSEHPGNVAHALFVYEENVHVPLLMTSSRLPRGLRVPQVLSTIDIAPTILDLIGAPALADADGRSQLSAAASQAYFAADHASLRLGLRHGPWKFLYEPETGRQSLFYLPTDPGERTDRAPQNAQRARMYTQALRVGLPL
jgi:hypothetical protein